MRRTPVLARPLLLTLAVLTAACSAPGPAQTTAAAHTQVVERWRAMTDEAGQLLRAGEPAEALRTLETLLSQMTERIGPGTAGGHAFGLVLMHRAAAQVVSYLSVGSRNAPGAGGGEGVR